MANDNLLQELSMLVLISLQMDSPVLSGSMKNHIELVEMAGNVARIKISAPSYDIAKWRKTGMIEYTGEYDYAVSVNNVGAFSGRSTKSRHWVNKSLNKICRIIANQYGAEVINNVEL